METIMLKVPDGTKARLKQINRNMSALLRGQVEQLLKSSAPGDAHSKAKHLICDGPGNLPTGRDYLKQYDPKAHR